jgi:hypothetical protein
MLNEAGFVIGRIDVLSACGRADCIPRTPEPAVGGRARTRAMSLYYLPREVFFFGLGFALPVPFAAAAACRFCFFVAT